MDYMLDQRVEGRRRVGQKQRVETASALPTRDYRTIQAELARTHSVPTGNKIPIPALSVSGLTYEEARHGYYLTPSDLSTIGLDGGLCQDATDQACLEKEWKKTVTGDFESAPDPPSLETLQAQAQELEQNLQEERVWLAEDNACLQQFRNNAQVQRQKTQDLRALRDTYLRLYNQAQRENRDIIPYSMLDEPQTSYERAVRRIEDLEQEWKEIDALMMHLDSVLKLVQVLQEEEKEDLLEDLLVEYDQTLETALQPITTYYQERIDALQHNLTYIK
jgi:hypothetical protein